MSQRHYCAMHGVHYTEIVIDGRRVSRCPVCAERGMTQRFVPAEDDDTSAPVAPATDILSTFDTSSYDAPSIPDSTPDTSSFDFGGGGGFDGGGGGDSF